MQLRSDVTTAHTLMQSTETDGLLESVFGTVGHRQASKSSWSRLRTRELVDAVFRAPAADVNLERRHVILGAIQREGCRTRRVAARFDRNRRWRREEAPWSCAEGMLRGVGTALRSDHDRVAISHQLVAIARRRGGTPEASQWPGWERESGTWIWGTLRAERDADDQGPARTDERL